MVDSFASNQNQKVVFCYYCGNNTLMDLVGEHLYKFGDDYDMLGYYNYQMYACPICGKVSFYQQYWDESQYDHIDEEILYPINTYRNNLLPQKVKEAYEAALKTKNIDNAVCLIALRRTLEIICNEKNAHGHNLWGKIEDLSKAGILPSELKNASRITKNYGNMGAHDTDVPVGAYELGQIIEFVKYILDYLYILPAKLSALESQLERRKTENEVVGTRVEEH